MVVFLKFKNFDHSSLLEHPCLPLVLNEIKIEEIHHGYLCSFICDVKQSKMLNVRI